VDSDARLGEDVEIGPFCVVEADVTLGRGTVLREGAIVRRFTTMGEGNFVDAHAVLGGLPQDLKFNPAEETYVRIGDRNVFREGVTISRATTPGGATALGSDGYWMAGAHAGHDATVGDHVTMVNHTCLAGHATLDDRVTLSAHASVHQFCWVGEGVMAQGHAGLATHIPPYVKIRGINGVIGLNVVGMRRMEISAEDRQQVKELYRMLFRTAIPLGEVVEQSGRRDDWGEPARKFLAFLERVLDAKPPYVRGLPRTRD
jgi:UDP-N-acetylglucosamine acyltransferase